MLAISRLAVSNVSCDIGNIQARSMPASLLRRRISSALATVVHGAVRKVPAGVSMAVNHRRCRVSVRRTRIEGSPQEFVRIGILRGFAGLLKSDVFGVGHRDSFRFEEQVSLVPITATSIDQHA